MAASNKSIQTEGKTGLLVHVAGVAGATLLGDGLEFYVSGRSGYQVPRDQYLEDSEQLQMRLDLRQAGYKTLEDRLHAGQTMIKGYAYDYSLDRYIDEKLAERQDDDAGQWVGNLLGQVYAGKVESEDARNQIFNHLCDR